ncbi:MAG: thiazole synthase [Oligoflexia bacterium]|nr:thiazole synthase [Oligoflexia bacterium]MBF0364349.1 thiazole synthase [Oligoflexia bacterium]
MIRKELSIGGKQFNNRLMIGTGKFPSLEVMKSAILQSECEIVTVSLRRIDLSKTQEQKSNILSYIPNNIQLLPNTSGARNAEEAIRIAHLCRALTGSNWIKVEVVPDPHHLLPDPIGTLEACTKLVADGFVVLPYINADPLLAKRLEEVGTATVMPLGAPIGTNRGLKTREMLEIIIENASIPVVVDAGIGRPSDAALAMEIGADAVLVNTAIAIAEDPITLACAFKMATAAGRMAYEIGLPASKKSAEASSPLLGFLYSNTPTTDEQNREHSFPL